MSSQEELPPGWEARWDQTHQRYLFIETETGRNQWEPPILDPEGLSQPLLEVAPMPTQPTHNPKKRQYAAGQTQAYYGAPEPTYGDQGFGLGAGGGGGQLFTPGLANEGFAAQQQQPPPVASQGGYYGGAYYDQGQGQQPPFTPSSTAAYGQQQQPNVSQLTEQFGQMGVGGAQKQYALYTSNLLTVAPDPMDLLKPPPEVRLPPGASLSNAPTVQVDPSYKRCTINAVPTTSALLSKSKLPFALVVTPNRSVSPTDPDDQVPLISDQIIARCRRCRAYIHPFVTFIDSNTRWKCTMCNVSNEVPQLFDWDSTTNQPADRWARAELNHSVVDFVAPTEYMVRPPQPPVYVFLIDVGTNAVQSGMVGTATRTILECLDRIPNEEGRTKVSIIAFDSALYFFSIPPATTDSEGVQDIPEAEMLVVSDIDDVFLPKPTDLLINLKEAREGLEALLGRLNEMFQGGAGGGSGSALGPALQAGYKMISPIGGKMVVLTSSLPTLGAGALKDRDDPKLFGTSKESTLLQAASSFYKTFAIDCSRSQVSVDMFLFSAQYQDVATLSCLPRYTSGQTYFYPAFNASRAEDALKFAHEFGEVLASPIGLEAVIRVRASRGLRMSAFHGNFFVRSTDLLALAAVPVDQTYCIEVTIEETIQAPYVVLQTGVLHTSSFGERRIRVVTMALPTTSSISEMYSSVDQIALATYFGDKAVERCISSKLEDARDAVTNKLADILIAYKNTMTAGGGGASAQLATADNMKMLPILMLGLLKHVALRPSSSIPSDLRAYAQALLTSLPPQMIIPYIHPNFYSLHDMAPEAGTVGEGGILLPAPLPLSSERLVRHGLFLIEDGQTMFLWIGRDAVPQLVQDVFGVERYELLQSGKLTLPILDNSFSQRVNAIVDKTREMRRGPYWPHLYLVKEDGEPALRLWALSALIQDRADQSPSYQQYLNILKDKVNGSGY